MFPLDVKFILLSFLLHFPEGDENLRFVARFVPVGFKAWGAAIVDEDTAFSSRLILISNNIILPIPHFLPFTHKCAFPFTIF